MNLFIDYSYNYIIKYNGIFCSKKIFEKEWKVSGLKILKYLHKNMANVRSVSTNDPFLILSL